MVRKITKSKIIEQYLNNYGKTFYLREIAELLKKPHQTIKPHIEELVKEKIINKTKRKNIVEYSLNLKNKHLQDYIIIAEKEKTIEKINQEPLLKILFEKLSIHFNKNTFIIFGSATNKIEKNSDIDLLIIKNEKTDKTIKNFEEVYNKKIHKIQIININKLTPTLLKEIYKKHIILNNTEEIIRYFIQLNEQNKLV